MKMMRDKTEVGFLCRNFAFESIIHTFVDFQRAILEYERAVKMWRIKFEFKVYNKRLGQCTTLPSQQQLHILYSLAV